MNELIRTSIAEKRPGRRKAAGRTFIISALGGGKRRVGKSRIDTNHKHCDIGKAGGRFEALRGKEKAAA
jgi:hypothetical protein